MKQLTFVIMLLLVVVLTSCEQDDPATSEFFWFHYYSFVTEQDVDFFEDNPDYEIPTLRWSSGYSHPFQDTTQIEDVQSFGYLPSWSISPFYLDYGNGDIDTLEVQWTPAYVNPASQLMEVEEIRHYYNGTLIATWTLDGSPDIADIFSRNFPDDSEDRSNRVTVKLPKRRNPEEIHD